MNFSFAKLGTTLVNTSKSQIRGRVRTSLDPFALFPVPRTFSASGLARLPMDLTFTTPTTHIAVLKPALRILRLDPEVAPLFMAPIVQSAFLSAEDSIFSFTWTSGELSIIVSDSMLLPFEKTLALMRSGQGGIAGIPDQPLAMRNSGDLDKEDSGYSRDFVVSSDKWIAIQVFMGVCGLDVAGGISLISSSLAEKHISLLNLSTFSADLILVRENDVQKAFECIKEVVSSMPSGQSKESKSKIRSQLWKSYSRLEIHELIKKKPNIRIAEIPGKYFIASMAKKQATAAMHCLLQAMFFSNAYDSHNFSASSCDLEV